MTNEEKAIFECQKELANKGKFFQTEMAQYAIQLAFEKGAEWKEKQMIDKAIEWLSDTLMSDEGGFPITSNGVKEFINDFKKAMTEGGEE